MRRLKARESILLVAAALVIVLALMARPLFTLPSQAPPRPAQTPTNELFIAAGPYASEEQWIAGETARAVVEMSRFARGVPQSAVVVKAAVDDRAAGDGGVKVTLDDRVVSIAPSPFVWAPATYRDLAVFELTGRTGSSIESDVWLIERLPEITLETLQDANRRVSANLAREFVNPAHHESAALLLAAFALRETSGSFFDIRRVLDRLTAHLTLADALRGGSLVRSLQGQLAEAALLTLVGRQRDAVGQLDGIEATAPGAVAAPWIRALRLRATLDWRRVAPNATLTRLERLELTSAIEQTTRAYANETEHSLLLPDMGWRRLASSFSVDDGLRFAEATWQATHDEAARALGLDPLKVEPVDLVAAVRRPPALSSVTRDTPEPSIQVIDAGLLAAFYARELAFASDRLLTNAAERQKSRPRTEDVRQKLAKALPDFHLMPLLERRYADDTDRYRASMDGLRRLVSRDVLDLSFANWARATRWPPRGLSPVVALPLEDVWYRRRFPAGTFYDPQRLGLLWPQDSEVAATVDGLYALAPWHVDVVTKRTFVRCRGRCDEARLRELYGPLAEYVTAFGLELAYTAGDHADTQLRVLCDRDGDLCWNLADWLLSVDRFEAAVPVFEEYIRRASDSVAVSSRVAWLAQYYFEKGRVADARRVAVIARRVGSAYGMRILARHLESTGDLKNAEELYETIDERYGDGEDLIAYRLRRARITGTKPRDAAFVALEARYFPSGLKRVSRETLTGPPRDGACVLSVHKFQERAGFRKDDVIVAADGIGVATRSQWGIVYALSFDHDMRVTVWRDGAYFDITAPFRKYQYGLDLTDYKP